MWITFYAKTKEKPPLWGGVDVVQYAWFKCAVGLGIALGVPPGSLGAAVVRHRIYLSAGDRFTSLKPAVPIGGVVRGN